MRITCHAAYLQCHPPPSREADHPAARTPSSVRAAGLRSCLSSAVYARQPMVGHCGVPGLALHVATQPCPMHSGDRLLHRAPNMTVIHGQTYNLFRLRRHRLTASQLPIRTRSRQPVPAGCRRHRGRPAARPPIPRRGWPLFIDLTARMMRLIEPACAHVSQDLSKLEDF